MSKGVVRMEIQILISMTGFPVYGDLGWAILVHVKAGVKKWNSAFLFFLRSELDVWTDGIEMIGKWAHWAFIICCGLISVFVVVKVLFKLYPAITACKWFR